MMRCLIFVGFLPLSLSLSGVLIPQKTLYDEFLDVLKTSDDCHTWYQFQTSGINDRNHTSYTVSTQKVLFEQYIDMRSRGMTDVIIEPLLNSYCRAKSHVPLALILWKPPSYVSGNYTWNLSDRSPDNHHYHIAKNREKVFMDAYEAEKNKELSKKKKKQINILDFKPMLRFAAFILCSSLALSAYNLLRLYYEGEDDEDDELFEHIQRFGMLGELMQFAVLSFSLGCNLMALSYFDPYDEE
ncbi:unnamed protein product [Caenorhabditis nigoni]